MDDNGQVVLKATFDVKPVATLKAYKGLKAEKEVTEVTDAMVEAEINNALKRNAREVEVTDRAAELDDTADIDFEGFVDGVPFEGGKADGYDLKLGSGSFIPGFEDQLIGAKAGEEKELHLTFPEDYHSEELAGADVIFKVKVNEVKRRVLPELDDDFVQDVSEFDTVEEYKADVEKKIRERKEKALKSENESAAVRAALKNASMDIPDAMVEEQAQTLVNEFAQRIQSQGMNMQQYMQITGMNDEMLEQQMRPQALERIQNSLLLEAVAKAENIEISDERLDEEIGKMAESYNMEKEKLYDLMGEESKKQMKQDLAVQEAVKVIAENAVEVDMPEEEPVDLEETPEENN
jgi:trigger factor